jgi:DNA-binding response OmpR family regulator
LKLHDSVVDFARLEIRFEDGQRAELSEREVELLHYFAAHRGRAISREELLRRVWRIEPQNHSESRTIDMHIANLRAKLRDEASAPRLLLTVRGKGYMLAAP